MAALQRWALSVGRSRRRRAGRTSASAAVQSAEIEGRSAFMRDGRAARRVPWRSEIEDRRLPELRRWEFIVERSTFAPEARLLLHLAPCPLLQRAAQMRSTFAPEARRPYPPGE
jgi:hypothetical protein